MAIPLIINGQTFQYPETGDPSWGLAATSWAAAVTSGMLQKAGGTFTLLADVDFGANFGVKSLYYKTRTASPASAGQFRLAKTDVISWHNNAGGGNLDLGIDGSDDLTFNGAVVGKIVSVTDTNSIDLTLSSGVLSADLILSAASATSGFFKATASIETDGLLVQAQIAATAQTGFLSSTDWNTFNGKQDAGSYITALTGDVTASGPGSVAATIANNAVTNAKAAQMAAHTFKGNNTGSTADALDLSATQLTAELNVMTGDSGSGGLKGLVPAQVAGDATKFLSGAGTWTSPAGSGDVVGPASAVGDNIVSFNSTTGKLIKDSGKAAASVVVGPSSATDGAVVLYDGTTGKLIKDSTKPYTQIYLQNTVQVANVRGSEGSGTTTLTITDNPSQVFNLSAGRTVKLPTTSVLAGQIYTIANPNAFLLTIQASDASAVAKSFGTVIQIMALSNTPVANTDWTVVGVAIMDQNWHSYTPTFTSFGTVSGVDFRYKRIGNEIEIRGNFASGTPAAAAAYLTLPSGFNIDTTVIGVSSTNKFGSYFNLTPGSADMYASNSAGAWVYDSGAGATKFLFSRGYISGTYQPINASAIVTSGDVFDVFIQCPIAEWANS